MICFLHWPYLQMVFYIMLADTTNSRKFEDSILLDRNKSYIFDVCTRPKQIKSRYLKVINYYKIQFKGYKNNEDHENHHSHGRFR